MVFKKMERVELIKEKLDKLQLEVDNLRNELEKSNEQKYPIYCRNKETNSVVKFTGLSEGEIVVNSHAYNIGYYSNNWISHTDTDVWQQLEVCPVTGLFDGQAVWCWDNNMSHGRGLKFYSVKNKRPYGINGKGASFTFDNYGLFEGNYSKWMLEAFETLER